MSQFPEAVAFEALTKDRRSCRAFLPAPVAQSVIDGILALAQRSPSWCNTQPWQLEISSGAATDRLRTALQEHIDSGNPSEPDFPFPETYTGLHRDRRRASGWQLYDAVGVQHGDRRASAAQTARNLKFFDAPHVAIVTVPSELGIYGAVDGGVFVANLLLAARAFGVDAIAQAAIARHASFIRRHFGIDDDRRVLVAVAFGYADEQHAANSFRTDRAPMEEIARHHLS